MGRLCSLLSQVGLQEGLLGTPPAAGGGRGCSWSLTLACHPGWARQAEVAQGSLYSISLLHSAQAKSGIREGRFPLPCFSPQ